MTVLASRSGEMDNRHEALAEVVTLYYIDGLDQSQIAKKMNVSRSTVSRMITEARQAGIVEIRINRPLPIDEALRREVITRYGLREALILSANDSNAATLQRVGALTAQYVENALTDGGIITISWGTSLAATVDALQGGIRRNVKVVQMIGAAGSINPAVDGFELARKMAGRLGGNFVTLNAPLLVDDPTVARALLRQRSVATVLDQAAEAEMALIGLGGTDPAISSIVRSGFATPAVLSRAVKAGVVGDVGGHMVMADGRIAQSELSDRMIGLDEARLRSIPTVVAIAAGPQKVDVIRAALLSGFINVLATDSQTIAAVLQSDKS